MDVENKKNYGVSVLLKWHRVFSWRVRYEK